MKKIVAESLFELNEYSSKHSGKPFKVKQTREEEYLEKIEALEKEKKDLEKPGSTIPPLSNKKRVIADVQKKIDAWQKKLDNLKK